MEKIITHRGEFLSRSDVLHRVELWRIGASAVAQPEELRFEAEDPLVIEWKETAKHEPICSSSATLRLDSPGDRTYTHLYTIVPGAVGMDVYRNGALYWTGTLDAEEYEEPYQSAEHYTVSLTFGDFGIWQRLKYSYSASQLTNGVETIGTLIRSAVARAGLSLPFDDSLVAATSGKPGDEAGVASWLGCSPDNFFDEDQKASTLSEAIAALLSPLGLKLVQRAGRVWLYDLQGLYFVEQAPAVVWSSDSQTLGVDSVANNVRISFSPYASNKLLESDDLRFPRPLHKLWGVLERTRSTRIAQKVEITHPDVYLFAQEYWSGKSGGGTFSDGGTRVGFSSVEKKPSFLLGLADNPNKYYPLARLCKFLPLGEGDEATAYCVKAPTENIVAGNGTLPNWGAAGIYETRRVYLPKIANPGLYKLRLRISILADRALCPITTPADGTKDKEKRDGMDKDCGWAFLSVEVRCTDITGQNIWRYDNDHRRYDKNVSTAEYQLYQSGTKSWIKEGSADVVPRCWLAYFDKSDPSKHSAIGGWKNNRNNIGQPHDKRFGLHNNGSTHIFDYENSLPDGELLPYPEEGGFLTIKVNSQLEVYPYNADPSSAPPPAHLNWFAVKAPDLEVVRSWGDCGAPEVPDIEYRATLHPDAKEELAIETKCGTLPDDVEGEPICRGLYLDARSRTAIRSNDIARAGVIARPEQLLINSIYSQYATRHTKLSGEAYIYDGQLAPRTEANQGRARFIVVEERQDLIADCGDITAIELTPDIYKAVESDEKL